MPELNIDDLCKGCAKGNPKAPGLKVCYDCDLRMEVGRSGSMPESMIKKDALGYRAR